MKQEHDYSGALEAVEHAINDGEPNYLNGWLEEICAALTAAKGDGWLPIESAPQDGGDDAL